MPSPFSQPLATPVYADTPFYSVAGGSPRAWEFNGWKPESLSWKQGCYIHGGLSGPMEVTFSGPDATKFLSGLCINGFSTYPLGASKHAIMLNEDGLVAAHGLLQRDQEHIYRLFASAPWALYQHSKTTLDVHASVREIYLFQIAGPTSLQTLERVTGESLRDIEFLRYRGTEVAGHASEVCRIGMSGTLAYELRGPLGEGAEVYDAVVRAGEEFGIQRLGWRTYTVNHVEGGFPQTIWTFMGAAEEDAGYLAFLGNNPAFSSIRSGSINPADSRARERTPVELDWHRAARFDHDFLGRDALQREVDAPARTIVTLRWNTEDVLDIYASLFRPGPDYTTLELPTHPHLRGFHAHADHVLRDGKPVGVSSGTTYSYHYREVISHCTIDLASADIGTEVVVQHGEFGGLIKDVRATVERYPYLDLQRNQTYDLDAVPTGVVGA
jgi:glycine cleavage system aminomethyltransferase T